MKSFNHYRMELRPRSELTTSLVLYGENEPPEMQIENLWKIVDRKTGEELTEPQVDFSEFTTGDILYPSMMKPEVKRCWDQKQYEKDEIKAQHAKLKRMVHAQFMAENPNLPVVQGLKKTTYGNEILAEFQKLLSQQPVQRSTSHENMDLNDIAEEVLQFTTPESEETFAVLAVNRDEQNRIKDKIMITDENAHIFSYQYDHAGRLQAVSYDGDPVEIYRFNQTGQRIFSHVSGSQPLKYQYNEADQLIRAGQISYRYDADGFLAEKNDPEGTTRYEYLESGQLCEVHLPDGRTIEYRFNEDGFRSAKYVNGKLMQRYHWKDLITLSALEDAQGSTFLHYNKAGKAHGMVRNKTPYLLAADQLGSVFAVADLSGNSVQEVLYDSFGRKIMNSNPEFNMPLGFAGGLYDEDTGLVHFGFREYDPVIGRFTSPDPLGYAGGDVDVYAYCQDEPVNGNDPLGLFRFGKRRLEPLKAMDNKALRSAAKKTPIGRLASAIDSVAGDKIKKAMDDENVELHHEHGFFEDGSGENIGFFDGGTKDDENIDEYELEDKHYDDKRMRRAKDSVDPGEYSLVGGKNKKKNNCQNYADKLRKRYRELERGDKMR